MDIQPKDYKLLKLVLFRYISMCEIMGDTEEDLKEFTILKRKMDRYFKEYNLEN